MALPPAPAPAPVPYGFTELHRHCMATYQNKQNPLQIKAVKSFILGGPDPLDFISIYAHDGDSRGVPKHWHYISFGLSDLYGIGPITGYLGGIFSYPTSETGEKLSGFGFELTFRLRRDEDEPEGTNPPIWPATVMQELARYVYKSKNILYSGDHVSWHCSLDESESKIGHMLMTKDPELDQVDTAYGRVKFIQIVGVCDEELKAAQKWEGTSIISIMSRRIETGGRYLVTDMRRIETIFDLDHSTKDEIDDGIGRDGSNLSCVSAKCKWSEKEPKWLVESSDSESDEANDRADKIASGQFSKCQNSHYEYRANSGRKSASRNASRNDSRTEDRISVCHEQPSRNPSRMSYQSETGASDSGELLETRFLQSVHLNFDIESGQLLPLVLRGRLRHNKHFTFKSFNGDLAISFVTPYIQGSHASPERPFAKHGPWLQICITEDMRDLMMESFAELADNPDTVDLPKTYRWPKYRMTITIVKD